MITVLRNTKIKFNIPEDFLRNCLKFKYSLAKVINGKKAGRKKRKNRGSKEGKETK